MSEQNLPLVPFGKYKGQPITSLMNDIKYLEWCKQQDWFKKFPIVYNICINQNITQTNQNTKTPEHNKLQNLFLKKENIQKFTLYAYKNHAYKRNIICNSEFRTEFEGDFNWDVIITDISYDKCKCWWKYKGNNGECNVCNKYDDCECSVGDDIECKCNDSKIYSCCDIYIEIKPLIGDDYPCVLRKMKTQIELTRTQLQNYKKENLKVLGYEKGFYGGRYWEEIQSILKNPEHYGCKPVLLINEFKSNNITKDELITIFKQSDIQIIFVNELFNDNNKIVKINKEIKEIKEIKLLIDKITLKRKMIKDNRQQFINLCDNIFSKK
jgi:hypothetical protein